MIKNSYLTGIMVVLLNWSTLALCNDVLIENVSAKSSKTGWTFNVTLLHEDQGWEHYADAWRVVDAQGNILGTRTLFHPHDNEQPFTRSLGDVKISDSISSVFIEAHDKVHGWSSDKFKVTLQK